MTVSLQLWRDSQDVVAGIDSLEDHSGLQIPKLSLLPFLTDSWSPILEIIPWTVKIRTQNLHFQISSQARLILGARGRFDAPK